MLREDRDRLRTLATLLAYRQREYTADTLALMWERFFRETEPERILLMLAAIDQAEATKGDPRS